MLEAIRALGGQPAGRPDPHQTSVRLYNQLRTLEVKDALATHPESQMG